LAISFGLGAALGARLSPGVNIWSEGVGNRIGGVPGTINLINSPNATLRITGVQLESGPIATTFEYRPYGWELELCQRYFEIMYYRQSAWGTGANNIPFTIPLKVSKRVTPTGTIGPDPEGWTSNYTGAFVDSYDTNTVMMNSTSAPSSGFTRFGAILSISAEII
jgi:hypothetical protein